MANQKYRIVSSDSHFVEPPDLWTSRLPKHLRDRAPRVEKGALMPGWEGEFWIAPEAVGANPKVVANFFCGGHSIEEAKEMNKRGYAAAPDFVFDPAARLKAQDRDGVSAEVLYTSAGMNLFQSPDTGLRQACFAVFNDWAAEYCGYDLTRLQGCAIIDVDDIDAGCEELDRIAKLGLRAGMIPGKPVEERPYSLPDYDRLWALAQDLDIPLALHVLTSRTPIGSTPFVTPVLAIADIQESLLHMIRGGVFERFPDLKIILTEVDASWIPHFLYRMDHYAGRYSKNMPITLKPSEYMKRNVWVTFQDEDETIPYAAKFFGAGRLMWASDFPHMNTTYPRTVEFIENAFPDMDPGDIQKITADNAIGLYKLGQGELARV